MEFGLSRITKLVRDHHKLLPWKAIHIAGTNGKGTTSRYLEALLDRSNVNVGLFNSPHLVDRHDCIRIGGNSVTKRLFSECEELVRERNANGKINATPFELLTATAYEIFCRAKVEVALIECGLGGRLDATNVLLPEEVLCSIITRIGLDHQDILGDSVEEIAAEKAGIIKPNVPVIVDRTNLLSVKQLLRRRADETDSDFDVSTSTESQDYLYNNSLLAKAAYYTITDRLAKIPGRVKKLRVLPEPVIHETMEHAARGFGGRFQFLAARAITGSNRRIILDGAHNEQAAKALRHKVDNLHESPQPVTWIIAMSSSKRSEGFLNALIRPEDSVVVCQFGPVEGMDWVKPQVKEVLSTLVSDITQNVYTAPSPEAALKTAAKVTPDDSQIIVSGSLYLVGDVIRLVRAANRKPETKFFRLPESTDGSPRYARVSEIKRRAEHGLCKYCGDPDHDVKHCPKLLKKHPGAFESGKTTLKAEIPTETSQKNVHPLVVSDEQKKADAEGPLTPKDWLQWSKELSNKP